MERLEHNQGELSENMDVMKGKVEQILEALLAMSKNNLQHVITENGGPTSDFTVATNPMYGLPPDYTPPQEDYPTQPQHVHITISNEVHIM